MMPFRLATLFASVALAASPAVFAQTFYYESGDPYSIPDVSTYTTKGDMMDGLKITAIFSDMSETITWGAVNPGSNDGAGQALGSGWSLKLNGDSYNNEWRFNTDGSHGTLMGLVLDGSSNYTLFDRTFNGQEGTPNSALGRDFEIAYSSGIFDTIVQYENSVGVAPSDPVGDLFKIVRVSFDPGYNASYFTFYQDTDNDVRAPVPEPSTYAMMAAGLGLVGFAVARRRKVA